jgi:hypothetical protein
MTVPTVIRAKTLAAWGTRCAWWALETVKARSAAAHTIAGAAVPPKASFKLSAAPSMFAPGTGPSREGASRDTSQLAVETMCNVNISGAERGLAS